jgi:hypothetical protein
MTDEKVGTHLDVTTGRHRFRFDRGSLVEGRLLRAVRHDDGRLILLELEAARLTLPEGAPRDVERYALVATGDVVTAHAGAVDAKFHADTPFSPVKVPRPRAYPPAERAMLDLYARAEQAHRGGSEATREVFPEVHAVLGRDFPQEWLLRWNLLESLQRVAPESPLVKTLWAELERLEVALDRRQPIASGLRYLASQRPVRS